MKVLNFKTKSFRKIPNPFYSLNNYMDNSEMYSLKEIIIKMKS